MCSFYSCLEKYYSNVIWKARATDWKIRRKLQDTLKYKFKEGINWKHMHNKTHLYGYLCQRNALFIWRLCLYIGNLIQSCSLKGFLKCRRNTVLNLSNSFLTMCQSRTLILFEGHQLIRHIGFNGASEGGTEHSSLFGLYLFDIFMNMFYSTWWHVMLYCGR